jgi:hypothetical protein
LPQAWDPRAYLKSTRKPQAESWLEQVGPARPGNQIEVLVAIGPAFGDQISQTINGLDHRQVLASILDGIHSQAVEARVVRVYHTSDCAFIGHAGAQLSGSGVAIGIQSKGTTVIHQETLAPLDNLELFPQAPNLDLETYRQIGVNAALYAQNKLTVPVPVRIDNTARLRLIVQTTLLHLQETAQVRPDLAPVELRVELEDLQNVQQ